MTPTTCPDKATFSQLLNQTPGLDGRDNRDKKHAIALVISRLVMALCAGRDGRLSSLHRHMVNHYDALRQATNSPQQKPVSRSQLPLLLAKINGVLFAKLFFEWVGVEWDESQKRWFACDGKELRGSIEADQRRRQACVSALDHTTRLVVGQTYYQGQKESERPATRQLLNDAGLYSQKLSLDALHLNPLTVNAIADAGGIYLIGLKANQQALHRYCICHALCGRVAFTRLDDSRRGHGRVEQRSYRCFALVRSTLDTRWHAGGPLSLVVVSRRRETLRGTLLSEELSYFVSNAEPTTQAHADELFDAVRHHWQVEVMHYQREVTLAEDVFRTGVEAINRLMSSLRTLTMSLLSRCKPKNMAAQLDNFADNLQALIQFLTQELVL